MPRPASTGVTVAGHAPDHRHKKTPQALTDGVRKEGLDPRQGLFTTIVGGMKNDGLSYVIDGPVIPVTLKVVEVTEML